MDNNSDAKKVKEGFVGKEWSPHLQTSKSKF